MRQLPLIIGWILGLGMAVAPAGARADLAPLRQLCAAAEQLADVEPDAAQVARREIRSVVREELRSAVRAEVARNLPRGHAGASGPRADSAATDTRGAAASAGEAAAQAQQARRNQDVAAARARSQGRPPLTESPAAIPVVPRPGVR